MIFYDIIVVTFPIALLLVVGEVSVTRKFYLQSLIKIRVLDFRLLLYAFLSRKVLQFKVKPNY